MKRVLCIKKRIVGITASFILCMALLTGCGGAMEMEDSYTAASKAQNGMAYDKEVPESSYGYAVEDKVTASGSSEPASSNPSEPQADSSRKLIRKVYLTTETLEFDSFIGFISEQTSAYGGYVESSDVSGNSINYSNSSRRATIVIRVPAAHLDSFVSTIGNLANITEKSESSEDVTLTYLETESRIASLEIQRDKLTEWMEECETVEEMIALESRLSEVRYELEYYGAILRNYDNLVEYSTLTLAVREVERITPVEVETVGERMSSGLSDTMYNIKEGLTNFSVWFVVNLPYLLFLAFVAVVTVVLLRRHCRKAKKNPGENKGKEQNNNITDTETAEKNIKE